MGEKFILEFQIKFGLTKYTIQGLIDRINSTVPNVGIACLNLDEHVVGIRCEITNPSQIELRWRDIYEVIGEDYSPPNGLYACTFIQYDSMPAKSWDRRPGNVSGCTKYESLMLYAQFQDRMLEAYRKKVRPHSKNKIQSASKNVAQVIRDLKMDIDYLNDAMGDIDTIAKEGE